MSAHVFKNLLNESGKSDKMRGLPSVLSHFRSTFNKFSNARACMSNSIYHRTLRSLKIAFLACKNAKYCHLLRKVTMDVIM